MFKKNVRYTYYGLYNAFPLTLNAVFEMYDWIRDDANPEICFYGPFLKFKDLIKHRNAVKIFVSTENVSADFCFFDYWIGFDFLDFGNRYFRFPLAIRIGDYTIHKETKTFFCDFCYSHERNDLLRKRMFELFSKYKPVINSGTYLNENVDSNIIYNFDYKKKIQRKCKFSLVIESTDCDGFITEKIVHALSSNCIPIYFGTNKVTNYFNKDRIILASVFESYDSLLKYVKAVDNDSNLYNEILNKPIFAKDYNFEEEKNKLNSFMTNIVENKKIYREIQYSPASYIKKIEKLLNHGNIFKKIRNILQFKKK